MPQHFDTIVVGGGPSGMMAALTASENGQKVAIIEKNSSLGKKLLLTGNGRCNLTNISNTNTEFMEKIGKSGRFLFSSLSDFGPKETMDFFEQSGVPLKIENNGRVFPVSDKSQDILNALTKLLRKNNVSILTGQNVTGFEMEKNLIECVKVGDQKFSAKNFILTTGGKSFPMTGSAGESYFWLEKLGHTINPPTPALVPIKTKEAWVKNLQGISLEKAELNLIQKKKKIKLGTGDIVFTHFGLSGPTAINASKVVGEYLKKGEVFLSLDLFPTLSKDELEEKMKKDFGTYQKLNLKTYLTKSLPQKMAEEILKLAKIAPDAKIQTITKIERRALSEILKNLRLEVFSLLDFNSAMVTSGGVSLKEVDPKTMCSKIVPNLFFAGEILDLDGPTGGYNLQIAWSTGRLAGAKTLAK